MENEMGKVKTFLHHPKRELPTEIKDTSTPPKHPRVIERHAFLLCSPFRPSKPHGKMPTSMFGLRDECKQTLYMCRLTVADSKVHSQTLAQSLMSSEASGTYPVQAKSTSRLACTNCFSVAAALWASSVAVPLHEQVFSRSQFRSIFKHNAA